MLIIYSSYVEHTSIFNQLFINLYTTIHKQNMIIIKACSLSIEYGELRPRNVCEIYVCLYINNKNPICSTDAISHYNISRSNRMQSVLCNCRSRDAFLFNHIRCLLSPWSPCQLSPRTFNRELSCCVRELRFVSRALY